MSVRGKTTIKEEAIRIKIFAAIIKYKESYEHSPSIREIQMMTGIKSAATVSRHLELLNMEDKISCERPVNETTQDIFASTKILAAVNKFHEKYGKLPTVSEIKNITELKSTAAIKKHLGVLKKEGKIPRSNTVYGDYLEEPRRMKILRAINEYHETHGFSPTVRELGKLVGLKSSSTVHRHLESLKEEGKISWNKDMPRTIRVLSEN